MIRRAVAAVFPPQDRARREVEHGLQLAFPEFDSLTLDDICLCLSASCRYLRNSGQASLDFCEYFAGNAAISRSMCDAGLSTKAFDLSYQESGMCEGCLP